MNCERHGRAIGGVCPVCAGIRKPALRERGGSDWRDRVEQGIRARPPSGPVDEWPDR